jgi:hypothetical protein
MTIAGHWLTDLSADRLLHCGKCGYVERKDLAGEARRLAAEEVARQIAAGVLKASMGVPQRLMQPSRISPPALADSAEG